MSGYLVGSGYNEYSSRESGALYTSPNCTSAGHIATHQFDGAGAASAAAFQSRPGFHRNNKQLLGGFASLRAKSSARSHQLGQQYRPTGARTSTPIRTGQTS